jgi:hypothetical protein
VTWLSRWATYCVLAPVPWLSCHLLVSYIEMRPMNIRLTWTLESLHIACQHWHPSLALRRWQIMGKEIKLLASETVNLDVLQTKHAGHFAWQLDIFSSTPSTLWHAVLMFALLLLARYTLWFEVGHNHHVGRVAAIPSQELSYFILVPGPPPLCG